MPIPLPPLALIQSFLDSNGVGQGIVIFLILGSILGWTAMIFRWMVYHRSGAESRRFYDAFRHEHHPLALFLRQQRFTDSPAYKVYLRACGAATRVLGIQDAVPLASLPGHSLNAMELNVIREAAERELAEQIVQLEEDMPIIATVTTAAPFLGLLGTVWGVMDAFGGMAVTGNPTLSAVAPGISAALLTTVIGLLVALPSLIGYNLLTDRLRKETVAMDNFVQELTGEFQMAFPGEC